MTGKQKAALIGAVVTLLGSAAAGLQGLSTASDTSTRIKVLEVQRDGDSKRLERIEDKVDEVLKRWPRDAR